MGRGASWQILGQQVLLGKLFIPRISEKDIFESERNGRLMQMMRSMSDQSLPFNLDAWDGYPKERERVYKILKKADSVLVLTGDTHNSWLNNLYDKKNNFIGIEIGTPSISSPNTVDTFGSLTKQIEEGFIKENKNVKWTNGKYKGYALLKLTKKAANVSFIYVSTVKSKSYKVIDINKFSLQHNEPII